ncbi:hypothetical protein K8Z49_09240 [Actinomadura madurae]|uniref:hypothetical protein n=1 Tax=Actinomadura madurae TaxID=1993 RepID=UPI00399C1577
MTSPGGNVLRLSAPARITPRALTDAELAAARAIADVLVPRAGVHPAATEDPEYDGHLARALAARRDAFETVTAALAEIDTSDPGVLWDQLRAMDEERRDDFQALSAVIVGAWLINPATRERIGYPGQRAVGFPFDAGTEELAGGLLDPVLERGPVGRPAPA